jgi:hypothetical protein
VRRLFGNEPGEEEAPRGIIALALLFFALAALFVVYALLLHFAVVSFTSAAWLAGEDVAIMGPVALFVGALAYSGCGAGLLERRGWARWGAVVLLGFGLVEQVPSISSMSWTWWPATRELALVCARVGVLRYLFREDVREAFER